MLRRVSFRSSRFLLLKKIKRLVYKCSQLTVFNVLLLAVLIMLLPSIALAKEPQNSSHIEAVPLEMSHPDPMPKQVVKAGESTELKGKVVRDEAAVLAALNAGLGIVLKPEAKDLFPARIIGVFPNSPMAKRGLVIGDRLLGEAVGDGVYTITIEHDRQGMRFPIQASEIEAYNRSAKEKLAAALKDHAGAVLQMPNGGVKNLALQPMLNAHKRLQSLKDVFENHDLVLIIDRSGSMITSDCPQGVSRWDWCCSQAKELAEAAAQASSAITAVFFNHQYNVFERLRPADIPTLFRQYQPIGGTMLGQPLAEQLDNYFRLRAKPLIIAIVTDGLPNDPFNVAACIDEASHQLRYVGEITITFLLISNEVDEQRLRAKLGERMGGSVRNGGMVDVISFDTLLSKGVKQAFFEELRNVRLATDRTKPSKAGQFQEITFGGRPGSPSNSSFHQAGSGFALDPMRAGLNAATRERSDLERVLLNKYR